MNNEIYIHNFAQAVSEDIFSQNEPDTAHYAIYTNVPVSCINRVNNETKSQINYSSNTRKMKVDFVFCVDKEIAFCALFNPGVRITNLFEGPLKGLMYVIPSPSRSTNSFAQYAKDTLNNYKTGRTKKSDRFEISVCPVNSLSEDLSKISESNSKAINQVLMNGKAIDENERITSFGSACEIMECFSADNSTNNRLIRSFKASKYSPSIFSTAKYFGLSKKYDNDKLIPLKDRLRRIDIGIPCDEAYGKTLALKLKEFLNTPLSQIMFNKKPIYCQIKNDVNQAKRLIYDTVDDFPLPENIVTYGELMNFLYRMDKIISSGKFECDDLELAFSNIIVNLGNFAYSDKHGDNHWLNAQQDTDNQQKNKANLKEQLDAVSKKSSDSNLLFSMMLGHYCYAASILTDSNYPNWLYRDNLQYNQSFGIDYEDPPLINRSVSNAISTARINIFENINDDNKATDAYVSFVFALLVLPVADINEIRKNNLGIFERRQNKCQI